jgi:hypothetical protein
MVLGSSLTDFPSLLMRWVDGVTCQPETENPSSSVDESAVDSSFMGATTSVQERISIPENSLTHCFYGTLEIDRKALGFRRIFRATLCFNLANYR